MEETKEKLGKIAEDVNGYRGFKMTEDPAKKKKDKKKRKQKQRVKGKGRVGPCSFPSPPPFFYLAALNVR